MKLAIVSLGLGTEHSAMAEWVNPGKQDYCERHGYDFLWFNRLLDPTRHAAWNKILAVEKVLPDYDWVLWCDTDTVLWNPEITLERFVPNDPLRDLVIQENHQDINSGVFLIRSSARSQDFLKQAYARTDLLSHPWWENQAFIELLRAPEWRGWAEIYTLGEPIGGFHGYYYFREWDKLFLHFAGMRGIERCNLVENLARLSRMPDQHRLMERNGLGDFLNHLGLHGEGVEVGVYAGEFSHTILRSWKGQKLHLVDSWCHLENYFDVANVSNLQFESIMKTALKRLAPFEQRIQVHRHLSVEAAGKFADNSMDFVYLDAGHHFEAVHQDLESWFPKVRRGGLICGHDFVNGDLPQGKFAVKRAVVEFGQKMGLTIAVTTEQHWPSWYAIKP